MYNDTQHPDYQPQSDPFAQTPTAPQFDEVGFSANTPIVAYDAAEPCPTAPQMYAKPAPETYADPFAQQPSITPYNPAIEADSVYGSTQYIPQAESHFQAPKETPTQPRTRKKEKKFITRKGAAVLCAFCILASSAASFGSVMLANSINPSQNNAPASPNGQMIHASSTAGNKNVLSVADITAKAENSVVEVATEIVSDNGFWTQPITSQAAGSGVIITSDGYIVTNNHVIEGAQAIQVRLKNGETYTAKLVGTDSKTDVAVLKIDASGLTPATLGDSDALKVGELAVAIGNPLGQLGGTVTDGIISALDREITLDNETMNLLQTNAAINPGNSGGGLFDSEGNLIGIVVAKSGGTNVEGLGFAIPINDVKAVIEDLMDKGYVTGRILLGVSLVDITTEREMMLYGVNQTGVYIAQVENNSVAAKGGAKAGDCIVSFNGKDVESAAGLKALLKECTPGDVVQMQVLRGTEQITLTLTLEEYVPQMDGAQALSGRAA